MKWYQKTWVMWFFLIGCWPIGVALLLMHRQQYTQKKFFTILALTGLWFLCVLGHSRQADVQKKQYEQAIAESQMATKNAQPQKERIESYVKQHLPLAENIMVTLWQSPDIYTVYFQLKKPNLTPEEAKLLGKTAIETLINGKLDAKILQYKSVVLMSNGSSVLVSYNNSIPGVTEGEPSFMASTAGQVPQKME
ncbi:MAG: hypothetical protein IJ849_09610 [Selenomonadaceae bacterium]|nr:hypothetical protein [Selenomonadaceae bacterium]